MDDGVLHPSITRIAIGKQDLAALLVVLLDLGRHPAVALCEVIQAAAGFTRLLLTEPADPLFKGGLLFLQPALQFPIATARELTFDCMPISRLKLSSSVRMAGR